MSKAIQGIALLGVSGLGLAAITFATGGLGAFANTTLFAHLVEGLALGGATMEAGAIASALTQQRGMNITTRQAAAPRQVIYGQQRVGGVFLFRSTSGSKDAQFNFVIVLAGHECDSIVNLYLDGRQVHWVAGSVGNVTRNGVNFGGSADSNTYTGPNGVQYNFGGKVYCEPRFGDQLPGDVIGGLTANDDKWAATESGSPYVGGCTYVYLKIEYDTNLFPGEPEIRFTVNGKNTIYDPRTGTAGFSSNWALCVADMITDPVFGVGDDTVNQDQLIAAANVCDEQVAISIGGTESRYSLHYHFDTSQSPGDVIETMMPGAAGRISRIGGEWFVWPAYWVGPSSTFDANALTGNMSWTPYRKYRDLVNRVNGTYIAPTYPYNVAGNLYDQNGYYNGEIQNNFPFAWQATNFPQYAADTLHGYSNDQFLTEDGGRQLPLEVSFSTVISVSQAQRIAKIMLLRNRQQGTGTFPMMLSAWGMQPIDVMLFTDPLSDWNQKTLEVTGVDFMISEDDEGKQYVGCSVNVQETDSSLYEWSTSEELSVYDVPATPTQTPLTPAAPTSMTLTSSAGTAVVGADGIVRPRVLIGWDSPLDILTTLVQVQYQPTGSSSWIDAGSVDVSLNSTFVSNVVGGQAYNFRLRSRRPNGASSGWLEQDNYTVVTTLSSVSSAGINPNSPYNVSNNASVDSIAENGAATIRVYGPGGDGSSFSRYIGGTTLTVNGAHITGQAFTTSYYIVYDTIALVFQAFADYNSTLLDRYAFIGMTVTCDASYTGASTGTGSTGGGSTGGGGGSVGGGRNPVSSTGDKGL